MNAVMARRTDSVQFAAVAALRQRGCTVRVLSDVGDGLPDLLVGIANLNLLIELKSADGVLTPEQVTFFQFWNGQKAICRTVDECLAVVDRAIRRR